MVFALMNCLLQNCKFLQIWGPLFALTRITAVTAPFESVTLCNLSYSVSQYLRLHLVGKAPSNYLPLSIPVPGVWALLSKYLPIPTSASCYHSKPVVPLFHHLNTIFSSILQPVSLAELVKAYFSVTLANVKPASSDVSWLVEPRYQLVELTLKNTLPKD